MTDSTKDIAGAEARDALEQAVRVSLRAPSVFNTQPWKWRLAGDVLELTADPDRRLGATDAEGRLLLLSCGGALHHARAALAAAGWRAEVRRFPEEHRPGLLARIRVTCRIDPDPVARSLVAAVSRRRTDRRAFGERRVSEQTLVRLRELVEAEGARLQVVPEDRVGELADSVDLAAYVNYIDPAHRAELTAWTHRPAWTGDGVPPDTVATPGLRPVPVREFLPGGSPGLAAGTGRDEGAAYVVIFGTSSRPADLLRGGEAMSALLLQATAEGLATAPISEAVEVVWPRQLLSRLLADGGDPYLVVRLGYIESAEAVPPSPRRKPFEVLEVED